MGAFGVAVVYPVIWYGWVADAAPGSARVQTDRAERVQAAGAASPSVGAQAVAAVPAEAARRAAQIQAFRDATRHVVQEGLPAAERRLELPVEDAPDPAPNPGAQIALAPLPEALPQTISQMSELQRLAADPQRLAEKVQTLESNSADLAELKAFAEMFVALPSERVDQRIISPSTREGQKTSRPGRPRP